MLPVEGVGAALIAMLKDAVAVSELAPITWTVKLLAPLPVGVPEIAPAEESVRPAGKLPEAIDHVYGVVPPLAVSVVLYAVFCVPEGNDVVLMVGGCGAGAIVRFKEAVAVCDAASTT